jgi:hypothetical protein
MSQTTHEQRTEERITVRQVTDVQVSWTEGERGSPGAFTLQLILDRGADEYVLLATAVDAEVLIRLLETHRAMFDLQRKVLMFGIDALDTAGADGTRVFTRQL